MFKYEYSSAGTKRLLGVVVVVVVVVVAAAVLSCSGSQTQRDGYSRSSEMLVKTAATCCWPFVISVITSSIALDKFVKQTFFLVRQK